MMGFRYIVWSFEHLGQLDIWQYQHGIPKGVEAVVLRDRIPINLHQSLSPNQRTYHHQQARPWQVEIRNHAIYHPPPIAWINENEFVERIVLECSSLNTAGIYKPRLDRHSTIKAS